MSYKSIFAVIVVLAAAAAGILVASDSDADAPLPQYATDDYDFLVKDGKAVLIHYKGTATDVTVPSTVTSDAKTYNVFFLFNTFLNNEDVKSVTVPEGVTGVGIAFQGCKNLREVTLPQSLKTIYDMSFNDSGIRSINLPSALESIGTMAFRNCTELESVTIPDSVKEIRENAFKGCTSLKSINLPTSLQSIWGGAFEGCTSLTGTMHFPAAAEIVGVEGYRISKDTDLTAFTVADGNTHLKAVDGILYKIDEGEQVVADCPGGKTGSVVIAPDTVRIEGNAFENCKKITTVILNQKLTDVGFGFEGCESLDGTLNIPDKLSSFGSIYGTSIDKLTVSENNIYFVVENDILYKKHTADSYILDSCPPGKGGAISLKENCTAINGGAFAGCSSVTSITLNEKLVSIGYLAFKDCTSLTSITIPKNVSSIFGFTQGSAISELKVDSLNPYYVVRDGAIISSDGELACVPGNIHGHYNIPDKVVTITTALFYGCKELTSVSIPSTVKKINNNAFVESGLRSVVIPEGVTEIEWMAFMSCKDLKTVELPSTLKDLDSMAFVNCTSLEGITIPGSVESVGSTSFAFCDNLKYVVIENGVESISESAFMYDSNIETVVIPKNVTGPNTLTFLPFFPCDENGKVVQNPAAIAGHSYSGYGHGFSKGAAPDKTSTLTYDSNGGTGYKPVTQKVGTTIVPPTPTKNGYRFVEWEEIPLVMPNHDITVKAVWEEYTSPADSAHTKNLIATVGIAIAGAAVVILSLFIIMRNQ